MATNKVTFTKLAFKKKEEIKTITCGENVIEVKQYLPINDKIYVITIILNNSQDENGFDNPLKINVYFNLELIYHHTNINFTDKQKKDVTKLFDLFEESGLLLEIIKIIPEDEYNNLLNWIQETIDNFYKRQNSALEIMEQISADYKDLNFNEEGIQKKLADPNNLSLLKNVMIQLG